MSKFDAPTFGDYLRSVRERAGLSLRELAAAVGVSAPYLMRLETGARSKPSPDVLQRLADALGVDAADLFAFFGVRPAATLPSTRTYFRRKLGVNANEADVLAKLIEDYQATKKGGTPHESNQAGSIEAD